MYLWKTDVVIIGGGSVGCAIARELSRFQLKSVLVEKNEDVCALTGKANSAIIHTGFDAPVGSLEAKLVVAARRMYDQLAQELDFPYQVVGALLVAVTKEQWQLLPELQRKALRNGVFDVHLLGRERVLAIEPELSDQVYGGLAIPRESIVSPYEMAIAMAENAIANGVKFFLGTRVTGIETTGGTVQAVSTTRGKIKTSWVINAAGMYCDEVAQMVGECDFTITPRRGEFFIMDKEAPQALLIY
ncbi:glycerol-3-phosphate dehydrogenase [Candidatus Hakubella thermalkaliphila]|uniref:Glycerol-3-phosphate dehydrogenase n=1 Tax=Candidatus Hakubella thermalkaliphila TaxID=2754717 RepID=A0A6V8NY82_9ACTN|nr:glycerol-3-phosphate dehydrogenase [Candidatus Hakubella thermalkaliphila]